MDTFQQQYGTMPPSPGAGPVMALAQQLAPLLSQQGAPNPMQPPLAPATHPAAPAAAPAAPGQPTISHSLFPNASQGQRNTAAITSGLLGAATGSPYASLAGLILPFLLGHHTKPGAGA